MVGDAHDFETNISNIRTNVTIFLEIINYQKVINNGIKLIKNMMLFHRNEDIELVASLSDLIMALILIESYEMMNALCYWYIYAYSILRKSEFPFFNLLCVTNVQYSNAISANFFKADTLFTEKIFTDIYELGTITHRKINRAKKYSNYPLRHYFKNVETGACCSSIEGYNGYFLHNRIERINAKLPQLCDVIRFQIPIFYQCLKHYSMHEQNIYLYKLKNTIKSAVEKDIQSRVEETLADFSANLFIDDMRKSLKYTICS